MSKLNWSDAEDIAIALYETHEEVNPLSVSFVQMHKWICELENFGEIPKHLLKARLRGFRWLGSMSGSTTMNNKKLCIYAKGDSYERLHTMVGLVSTAASMDWEAHVYMTYGALWRYCHETMAEAEVEISTPEVAKAYKRGIDSGRIPDLDEFFEEARELGGERIRIYACTTSIKLLHIEPKLLEGFDGMLGHASFLQIAADGKLVVT